MKEKSISYKDVYYIHKNKIFFLFYLLLNPNLLAYAIRGLYLPVLVQFLWLRKYQIGTFVDVGASRGNETFVFANLFPQAEVHAFEPIRNEFNKLKSKIGNKNIFANNIALSNKSGKSIFYQNTFTPVSSMLPFNRSYDKFSNNKVEMKTEIKTTTLDQYFSSKKIQDPVLIKLDTQGSELMILKGAKKLLQKTAIIHIEISYYEFYKGQPLFDDIYKFLKSKGFVYLGNANDADFYPQFGLLPTPNAIFANPKNLKHA